MDQTSFNDFLKAEYNNIAQAHFNINSSVAEFFKAYIAIVSVPISFAVIFAKPSDLASSGMLSFLKQNIVATTLGVGGVWLIGLFVMMYLANLRCDALLYARAVNGIRRHFYAGTHLLAGNNETDIRGLPTDVRLPRYFEPCYFLFVVLTFGAVGTAYLLAAIYLYGLAVSWIPNGRFWLRLSGVAMISLLIHVGAYWLLTLFREHGYLKLATLRAYLTSPGNLPK